MKTIYKYPLTNGGSESVSMPEDSEILSLQVQQGVPCIWALVDTDKASIMRRFTLYGTGHYISSQATQKFIGTFQVAEGELVFHVFEDLI